MTLFCCCGPKCDCQHCTYKWDSAADSWWIEQPGCINDCICDRDGPPEPPSGGKTRKKVCCKCGDCGGCIWQYVQQGWQIKEVCEGVTNPSQLHSGYCDCDFPGGMELTPNEQRDYEAGKIVLRRACCYCAICGTCYYTWDEEKQLWTVESDTCTDDCECEETLDKDPPTPVEDLTEIKTGAKPRRSKCCKSGSSKSKSKSSQSQSQSSASTSQSAGSSSSAASDVSSSSSSAQPSSSSKSGSSSSCSASACCGYPYCDGVNVENYASKAFCADVSNFGSGHLVCGFTEIGGGVYECPGCADPPASNPYRCANFSYWDGKAIKASWESGTIPCANGTPPIGGCCCSITYRGTEEYYGNCTSDGSGENGPACTRAGWNTCKDAARGVLSLVVTIVPCSKTDPHDPGVCDLDECSATFSGRWGADYKFETAEFGSWSFSATWKYRPVDDVGASRCGGSWVRTSTSLPGAGPSLWVAGVCPNPWLGHPCIKNLLGCGTYPTVFDNMTINGPYSC